MCKKYWKTLDISVNVIRLDLKHGHLKWKITDLSRIVGVSRSQVYDKLGSSKSIILTNSLSLILDELYGFASEHRAFSKEYGEFRGLLRSRKVVFDFPELLSFYFLYRNSKNDLGVMIREKESLFLDLVAEKNNIKDKKILLFVRTMIHGVSVAPFLDDKQVSECMQILSDVIRSDFKIVAKNNSDRQ